MTDKRGELHKAIGIKDAVIKINIAFLALLLVSCLVLLLRPSSILDSYSNGSVASLVRCTLRNCKLSGDHSNTETSENNRVKERTPSFLDFINDNTRIGLVNMEKNDLKDWGTGAKFVTVQFERVSSNITWDDLFPEDEESKSRPCPEIPMPDFTGYDEVDAVITRLPCRKPEEGWNRDVFRLQVHMVSVNLATRKTRREQKGTMKLIFLSKCEPMKDVFRCDDLVGREGEWWIYAAKVEKLEEKLRLPLGTCNFALPIWGQGTNNDLDASKQTALQVPGQREAYATVLHSSDIYVCGAITLAHSIRRSGSTRDLVLLHDESIPEDKLKALATMGWSLRKIIRIRNPQAEPGSYNEYNYSKFTLWQLTDYDKIVYIDSDVLVLRNLDILFGLPQISAASNHKFIFNSGIMVIEPSNCTFNTLMQNHDNATSYNGGDQGFLNEHFVSWHRIPKWLNYLTYFEENVSEERTVKEDLFQAEPPNLYSIHYLGLKPWFCYRDYDCNWDREDQRSFASDIANQRWWRFYDELDTTMQVYCQLSERRKIEIMWARKIAGEVGFRDEHWRINITDPRKDL